MKYLLNNKIRMTSNLQRKQIDDDNINVYKICDVEFQ